MSKLSSIFNVSCGASILMVFYIGSAGMSLLRLMYPLASVDQSQYDSFVHPLWTTSQSEEMHLRVYLSTSPHFEFNFLETDFWTEQNENGTDAEDNRRSTRPTSSAMLWEEVVSSPAFSKSFLLTTIDCADPQSCRRDDNSSFYFAKEWLDRTDRIALERGEGGVVAAMAAAGQGIESTSFLLSLYRSLTRQIRKLFIFLSLIPGNLEENDPLEDFASILDRKTIFFHPGSDIWDALTSNSTVHVHVVLLRKNKDSGIKWPPQTLADAIKSIKLAQRMNSILIGRVGMVKYDPPHHIGKPRRLLYRDLVYWWNKYVKYSREMPPWVMEITKPEETMAYKQITRMKEQKQPYPYWKPEVSIKYVNEVEAFPYQLAGSSGLPGRYIVGVIGSRRSPPTSTVNGPPLFELPVSADHDSSLLFVTNSYLFTNSRSSSQVRRTPDRPCLCASRSCRRNWLNSRKVHSLE